MPATSKSPNTATKLAPVHPGAITGETALRLGRYFDTTPDCWINLQARFDLEAARDAWESRIASEVKPHQAA